MTSNYYVKVYYTKQQQQQPEIRRFAIDISPDNDIYQELCTKIATYQPDIQLNGFTLQYIDEENERITFSSNDELRSAILINKDSNALKIFVTINQSINQQESTINNECHNGVECDNCKGSIIGFRYKCVICPNYDLCEKCSSSGIHSEHNMIKITKPGKFYHPYGSRCSFRRYRHMVPPAIPNTQFFEQIQTQIPQWLPNRENAAQFRANMQHHFDSIKSNTQTHMQNSKQYLESVGQYLQQTLSPLGIDCDYHVDGNTSSTTNTQQQTSTNENINSSEPSAVPKNSNTNNQQQQQQQQQQRGISSLLNMFRTNATTSSTASATASNNTSQSSSAEKAVEECVEKMKAMGFDDKDENLLQLIRSKNGDLVSVLDEMSARLNEN